MSVVSDGIEAFIRSMMKEDDEVELRRNELAQYFGCAPSQINYVLTTRFSIERGYLVRSKRGGGGYILVQRIPYDGSDLKTCITEQIGQAISLPRARALLANLRQNQAVTARETNVMLAVLDKLPMVSVDQQDAVRAYFLKRMMTAVLHENCGGANKEEPPPDEEQQEGSA